MNEAHFHQFTLILYVYICIINIIVFWLYSPPLILTHDTELIFIGCYTNLEFQYSVGR